MELVVIVGVVAVVLVVFTGFYNGFVKLRNQCDEALATMNAYLKKRWDMIPNLVETVKGYASHEKETLERVIEARNRAMGSPSMSDLGKNESSLAAGLKSIFALSEAYPDLKANEGFVNLQNQLQTMETDILQSRKYYNAVVKEFNTKREIFPLSLVASMMKLEKKDYFLVDEAEQANVRVSF